MIGALSKDEIQAEICTLELQLANAKKCLEEWGRQDIYIATPKLRWSRKHDGWRLVVETPDGERFIELIEK